MVIKLDERPRVSVGDTELISINYTDHLNSAEVLTEPVTVAEVSTTDLTIGSAAVNSATYIEVETEDTVAVGKAVQFMVSGGHENIAYTIRITVTTNSSPARIIVRDIELLFE